MLSKLRNFTKSKLALVLIAIIIIPFVFWGMGSVFSGGNTNIVAKVGKKNISTEDFINYIQNSRIDPKDLKKNLDKNVLEEILSQVISLKIIEEEIKSLGISISDKSLFNKITNDKKFIENKKFSRVKYEKFLLENNIPATHYEKRVKENELQSNLFIFIGGGIKTPTFLKKNFYKEETKEIITEYINLENIYKNDFTDEEINKYLDNNEKNFRKDYIDVNFSKINPQSLINSDEYSKEYFQIIDEIDNLIINGESYIDIVKKFNLKSTKIENYQTEQDNHKFLVDIYETRNNQKTGIIDKDDFFVIFEIEKVKNKLPNIYDEVFKNKIVKKMSLDKKIDFNKELLKKIETNKFNYEDFVNTAKDKKNIKELIVKSKNDKSFFNVDSLELLYSIPKNNYILIVDNDMKVYLTRVKDFIFKDFLNIEENIENSITLKSNFSIRDKLTKSYDNVLNQKYNVEVYNNTLERVKNYFK